MVDSYRFTVEKIEINIQNTSIVGPRSKISAD